VILLNKCDQMAANEKDQVKHLIKLMNPTAKVVESTFSAVPLDTVLGTGLFSMSEAEQHEGWLKEVSYFIQLHHLFMSYDSTKASNFFHWNRLELANTCQKLLNSVYLPSLTGPEGPFYRTSLLVPSKRCWTKLLHRLTRA